MQSQYTSEPLLDPLRRLLPRPRWQLLVVVLLAVQLGRTLILQQLGLFLLIPITSAGCHRRLTAFLAWKKWQDDAFLARLRRAWVRAVVACFAPGNGPLILLIDWTWHRDRCRSLWVMLPVGGRAVPLGFWLAGAEMGGEGTQRELEDRALRELDACLPGRGKAPPGKKRRRRRKVVLIGDRGFRGAERMQFLRDELGWHFVLRVTGDTCVQLPVRRGQAAQWVRLSTLTPAVGARRQFRRVRYGKEPKPTLTGPMVVNLVSVHQALLAPKEVRTNKGKRTGKKTQETTWLLATDLPLGEQGVDAVALYQMRMQIEQSFRDFKSLLGMEQEKTRTPAKRLEGLLWALMVGLTLDLWHARPRPEAVTSLPPGVPESAAAPSAEKLPYRRESATREGLHQLIVAVLTGTSVLAQTLRARQEKARRMQERPQTQGRRRSTPALRHRTRRDHAKSPA